MKEIIQQLVQDVAKLTQPINLPTIIELFTSHPALAHYEPIDEIDGQLIILYNFCSTLQSMQERQTVAKFKQQKDSICLRDKAQEVHKNQSIQRELERMDKELATEYDTIVSSLKNSSLTNKDNLLPPPFFRNQYYDLEGVLCYQKALTRTLLPIEAPLRQLQLIELKKNIAAIIAQFDEAEIPCRQNQTDKELKVLLEKTQQHIANATKTQTQMKSLILAIRNQLMSEEINQKSEEIQRQIELSAASLVQTQKSLDQSSLSPNEKATLLQELAQAAKPAELITSYASKIHDKTSYINPFAWANYFTHTGYQSEQAYYQLALTFLQSAIRKNVIQAKIERFSKAKQALYFCKGREFSCDKALRQDLSSQAWMLVNQLPQGWSNDYKLSEHASLIEYFLSLLSNSAHLQQQLIQQQLNAKLVCNLIQALEELRRHRTLYALPEHKDAELPSADILESKWQALSLKHAHQRNDLNTQLVISKKYTEKIDHFTKLKEAYRLSTAQIKIYDVWLNQPSEELELLNSELDALKQDIINKVDIIRSSWQQADSSINQSINESPGQDILDSLHDNPINLPSPVAIDTQPLPRTVLHEYIQDLINLTIDNVVNPAPVTVEPAQKNPEPPITIPYNASKKISKKTIKPQASDAAPTEKKTTSTTRATVQATQTVTSTKPKKLSTTKASSHSNSCKQPANEEPRLCKQTHRLIQDKMSALIKTKKPGLTAKKITLKKTTVPTLGWTPLDQEAFRLLSKDNVRWYLELRKALKKNSLDGKPSLAMIQLMQDIHTAIAQNKATTLIESYKDLCPQPLISMQALIMLKPALPLVKITGQVHLDNYSKEFHSLFKHYLKLKPKHPFESSLLLHGMNILAAAKKNNALNHLPLLYKDPLYQPLAEHRGFAKIWVLFEKLCHFIIDSLSGSKTTYCPYRPHFFQTQSIKLLQQTEEKLQAEIRNSAP